MFTTDILGKDDLNNLLGKYPDVEKKYYKLWLASTNILQEIVNKSVVNWASFELDTIRDQISLYVENKSFNKASEILEKNRYVIISGIPGIGKTTLARYLVYSILANGYEEFVYIENNLDDAAKLFQKGKRQIFFYDDFLGSNFFDPSEKNFDSKLIHFIDAIKREPDKLFILTTREYILSDALNYYEKLERYNVEIAKCTLDLGHYTKYIRAKILYNHLERAELPIASIESLLKDKRYKILIEHKNYNPRIIETFIDSGLFRDVSSDVFFEKFREYFDNPKMVWSSAFDKLDIKGRIALQILYSMGKVVFLKDWHDGFMAFCQNTMQKRGLICDEVEWRKCLKTFENCFVKIDINEGHHIVSFFNPSIIDFIGLQLGKDCGLQKDIMESAIFVNQIYTVFRDSPMYDNGMQPNYTVDESLYPIVVDNFKRLYNHSKSCSLVLKTKIRHVYENESDVIIACRFIASYPNLIREYEGVVESVLNVESLTSENISFSYRVQLIRKLNWDYIDTDRNTIIDSLIEEGRDLDEHVDLLSMLDILNLTEEKCNEEIYNNIVMDFVSAIESVSSLEEAETIGQMVDDIEVFLPNKKDIENIRGCLEEKKAEIEVPDYDDYDSDWRREIDEANHEEEKKIDEMMTSLRSR